MRSPRVLHALAMPRPSRDFDEQSSRELDVAVTALKAGKTSQPHASAHPKLARIARLGIADVTLAIHEEAGWKGVHAVARTQPTRWIEQHRRAERMFV